MLMNSYGYPYVGLLIVKYASGVSKKQMLVKWTIKVRKNKSFLHIVKNVRMRSLETIGPHIMNKQNISITSSLTSENLFRFSS